MSNNPNPPYSMRSLMVTVSTIAETHGSRYNSLSEYLWVHGVSGSGNDCVETVVVVSGVMDSSQGAIGFSHGVRSFDNVTITNFLLGFMVTSVTISNTIVKFIFGVCLESNENVKTKIEIYRTFP